MDIEFSDVPMWIFDQETLQILAVNEAAIARYGYSREEFLNLTLLDIRPADSIPRFLHSALGHPHATMEPETWLHRNKKGEIFAVRISSREIAFRDRKAELVRAEPQEVDCMPRTRPNVLSFPDQSEKQQ